MNKTRIRLDPRLIAQTQPFPPAKNRRPIHIAGIVLLVTATFLLARYFGRETPKEIPGLPEGEAILGAQQGQVGPSDFYFYEVQKGDTLFSVSQKFQVRWEDIVSLNGLKEPFPLESGQKLKIPATAQTKQQQFYDNLKRKIYIVEPDDSFVGVAQKLNISVTDLLRANPNLESPDFIKPGQILRLP